MDAAVLAAFITGGVALGVGVGTLINTYIYNRATIREKKQSERRAAIAKKLNELYAPLHVQLSLTLALSEIFKADKPAKFRTVTYLLDPAQTYDIDGVRVKVELTQSDRHLLDEILKVEGVIEKLLFDKSGLIDDEELIAPYKPTSPTDGRYPGGTSLLAALLAHFRILRLARDGRLHGEVDRFSAYVYPRPIDDAVAQKMISLKAELAAMVKG